MGDNSNSKEPEKDVQWALPDIREARKTLIDFNASQANSQGTRLIGFVAGLFVLLQLTQASKAYPLAEVFPNFPRLLSFGDVPLFWDFLKGSFLFVMTAIILYFILRTIFRFSVFSLFSSEVTFITEDDAKAMVHSHAKRCKNPPCIYNSLEIWALNGATSRRVCKKNLYWLFPASFFFSSGDPEAPTHEKFGVLVLLAISLTLAFLLLRFLW